MREPVERKKTEFYEYLISEQEFVEKLDLPSSRSVITAGPDYSRYGYIIVTMTDRKS
jgi:hypothetical protein